MFLWPIWQWRVWRWLISWGGTVMNLQVPPNVGNLLTTLSTTLLLQRDPFPWGNLRLQKSAGHKSSSLGTACCRQKGYLRIVSINGLVHSFNSSKLSTGTRSCNYLLVRSYKWTQERPTQQPDRRHGVCWSTQQLQNTYGGYWKHSTEQQVYCLLYIHTDWQFYRPTTITILFYFVKDF
jgi:hypothetical protein